MDASGSTRPSWPGSDRRRAAAPAPGRSVHAARRRARGRDRRRSASSACVGAFEHRRATTPRLGAARGAVRRPHDTAASRWPAVAPGLVARRRAERRARHAARVRRLRAAQRRRSSRATAVIGDASRVTGDDADGDLRRRRRVRRSRRVDRSRCSLDVRTRPLPRRQLAATGHPGRQRLDLRRRPPARRRPWMSSGIVVVDRRVVAASPGRRPAGCSRPTPRRHRLRPRAARSSTATGAVSRHRARRVDVTSRTTYAVPIDDRRRRSPTQLARPRRRRARDARLRRRPTRPPGPTVTAMAPTAPAARAVHRRATSS